MRGLMAGPHHLSSTGHRQGGVPTGQASTGDSLLLFCLLIRAVSELVVSSLGAAGHAPFAVPHTNWGQASLTLEDLVRHQLAIQDAA